MKTSLTGILVYQAFASVHEARDAQEKKNIELEVSSCVVAQMLLALTIEGTANEIADHFLPKWPQERLEPTSAAFKWWFLSGRDGRTAFAPSNEPLQTVKELTKVRNQIAHPKVHDFGDEIIIQDVNRDIQRNVPKTQMVRPGDRLAVPTMQFREDHGYNYERTLTLLKRTLAAVIQLRDHLGIKGFAWAEHITLQLGDN
jgi:hypothetical protein